MKILIVSDSHRITDNLFKAVDKVKPDHLIHLGDIEDDTEYVARYCNSPRVPCLFIKGNCDLSYRDDLLPRSVFKLNGHKFYCCHGHHEKVNYGLATLALSAASEGCDIALFGHTHVPFDSSGLALPKHALYEQDNFEAFVPGLRILNPGSISLPRGGSAKGYMVMDMEAGGRYSVSYHTL